MNRAERKTHDQECERLQSIERIQRTTSTNWEKIKVAEEQVTGHVEPDLYCEVKSFV